MIVLGLKVILILLTVVFTILWILQPGGNFEPWTVICGAAAAAIEIFQSLQKRARRNAESETNPSDNVSDTQQQSTTTQTHSRTGDNLAVGQVNIRRQINMGPNSTYNETNMRD